jgi:hypothetical protein
MLSLRTPSDLAEAIGFDLDFVINVLKTADRYLNRFVIQRPNGKPRPVVSASSPLYNLQRWFFIRVLSPNFKPSPQSHGGIPSRSIKTNAAVHVGQQFIYTTDVSDFFPSIRFERVRAWFERSGCSATVSRMCARLCTADGRLQQGLLTSPFIADQLMKPVDLEISRMCEKQRRPLVYSRYVDDLTITGQFNLEQSRIPHLVRRILRLHGFRAKVEKEQFGTLNEGVPVTKVRIRHGKFDVVKEYASEVVRSIHDHISLVSGGDFTGPYLTQAELWGKVSFICWVNPGREPELFSLLGRIDWERAFEEASRRGLLTLFTPELAWAGSACTPALDTVTPTHTAARGP